MAAVPSFSDDRPTLPRASRGDAEAVYEAVADSVRTGAFAEPRLVKRAEWAVDHEASIRALTTFELWTAVASGEIPKSARIWREGMECWTPAELVPEVACALERVSTPPAITPDRSSVDDLLALGPDPLAGMTPVEPRAPLTPDDTGDLPLPLPWEVDAPRPSPRRRLLPALAQRVRAAPWLAAALAAAFAAFFVAAALPGHRAAASPGVCAEALRIGPVVTERTTVLGEVHARRIEPGQRRRRSR